MKSLLLAVLLLQQGDSAAFVRKLIAAINTHREAPRLALRHARDVCMNDEVRRLAFARHAKYTAAPNMKWLIAPMNPAFAADPSLMTFAVKPTHLLQLNFQTGQLSSATVLLQLVHDASGWHEVFGCATPAMIKQITDAKKRKEAQQLDERGLEYRWRYPYNTTIKEDHYIVIDTTGGMKRGWYYGTTDDFDEAREGYTPGFYVAPMDKLSFAKGTISFSVTLPPYVFHEPVSHSVRDGRQFNARRWTTVALKGTRDYRGTVAGDSITIVFDRVKRVYKR